MSATDIFWAEAKRASVQRAVLGGGAQASFELRPDCFCEEKVNGSLTYQGRAMGTTVETEPKWQIVRISRVNGVIKYQVAGHGSFDYKWSERAILFADAVVPSAEITVVNFAMPAANQSYRILAANPLRKSVTMYNNAPNSAYVVLGPVASGNTCQFIIPTFANWSLPAGLNYTGEISAFRNAGAGATLTMNCVEFLQ